MLSKLATSRQALFATSKQFVQVQRPITRNLNTFRPLQNSGKQSTKLVQFTAPKRAFGSTASPTINNGTGRFTINYLVGGAAIIGLTGVAAYNYVNSHSAATPDYVTQRVRKTYLYLAGSLAFTAAAARQFYVSGFAYRMQAWNPWLLFGASFAAIIGSSILTQAIPYENTIPKHLALATFCTTMGAVICPVVAVGGPILVQAAAATAMIVGSLSAVAAAAPEQMFSGLSGPLSIGLGALIAASFGTIAFPASGLLANVVVYGGTALFSCFVLFDTQKLLERAKYSQTYDPVNNCIGIYMSTVNIFMSMVNILSNNRRR